MNGQPSLRNVFESLNDPVEKRYKQPLGRTLTLIFLAMVSGESSERGIADWLKEQCWRLKSTFGYRRGDVPSYSTIRRALEAVEVSELEGKLVQWAEQLHATMNSSEWEGVAIDGKVLRGSGSALDILNAFSHEVGVVMGQRLVGSKTNEIPEIIPLLEELTLTGKLVTVDALHTQRDTAQAIVKKGGPI